MPKKTIGIALSMGLIVAALVASGLLFLLRPRTAAPTSGPADIMQNGSIQTSADAGGRPQPLQEPPASPTTPAVSPLPSSNVSDVERIAVLNDSARALHSYFLAEQKYPAAFADMYKGTYAAPRIDSSYSYDTDVPDQDMYSLCTNLKNGNYACLSSDIGDEPVTFTKNSLGDNPSDWHWEGWQEASSSDELGVPFPQGWTEESQGEVDTADLLATNTSGDSIILARFNFKNYLPYTNAQTAKQFGDNLIAHYPPNTHVLHTATTTVSGIDAYQIVGTDATNDQQYGFVTLIIARPGYFHELDFFGDLGLWDVLTPTLRSMVNSVTIRKTP